MKHFFRRQPPARLIALGFLAAILLGSGLLCLPCSVRPGVTLRYIDSLYTSTSAVCVTGLVSVDARDTFTPLGQTLLALLIQIGGLGVTSIGAGLILLLGRRLDFKGRSLVQEAMNLASGGGIVKFVRQVFFTTVTIELAGAALSYPVFARDFPPLHALGISLFHAIAAFNNSGFDILGGMRSLTGYRSDVLLNLTTCALIFLGGIGFFVIREMREKRFRWKTYSLHAKLVLSGSAALILAGTLLLKLTEGENLPWLGALFNSVDARTAGFSTYPLSGFSDAGLLVVLVLMLIGASPGSTGGGVKVSTAVVLFQGVKAAATNQYERAFRYAIPKEAFRKAAVITLLALTVIFTATFLLLVLEPGLALRDALFEMTSAFGTVGLSTGISPGLSDGAKLLSMLVMYIGRLGPFTIASLFYFSRGELVRFPEGTVAIG